MSDQLKPISSPNEQPIARVIGRRVQRGVERVPRGPTPEERAWVRSMANYKTGVPKGVFRYRSHEEANQDWERWHAAAAAEVAMRTRTGWLARMLEQWRRL